MGRLKGWIADLERRVSWMNAANISFVTSFGGPVAFVLWALTIIFALREGGMPLVLALVDLIKGIAWPAAIVAVLLLFRADVSRLIPRLREIGPTGAKLDPAQKADAQRAAAEQVSDPSRIVLKDLPGLARTDAIANLERVLHAALVNIPPEEQVDRLVRLLAEARIATEFEKIYRLIFGSQIAGLRELNSRHSVPTAEARRRFDEEVVPANPDFYRGEQFTFEQWLGFLRNSGLVAEAEERLSLTPLGKDFLGYLTALGLREDRPL